MLRTLLLALLLILACAAVAVAADPLAPGDQVSVEGRDGVVEAVWDDGEYVVVRLAPQPTATPEPTASPTPEPTPTATATPTATPAALWTGDHEEGNLGDWNAPETSQSGNYGGGEYNSGNADSIASTDRAHSGTRSAKQTVTGSGGTRLFRWRELQQNRTVTVSSWRWLPQSYTLTGPACCGQYWIIDEFKSSTADGSKNDPFWYVNAYRGADGLMHARLAWGYQSGLAGPHAGETGWRNYGDVILPLGRWFKIEATITQSKDFDGAIKVTVDGTTLADLTNVRTGHPDCTFNAWCVDQAWAITNYTDGISPSPASIYADDALIVRP